MHGSGSGLLDPVLENKIKGVDPLVSGKVDPLVLAPKWRFAWEGRSHFLNSVTGSGFVAKISNILQDR